MFTLFDTIHEMKDIARRHRPCYARHCAAKMNSNHIYLLT